MKRYLGVDLHRNCFTVCTLGEDGKSELRKWSIHSLGEFAQEVQTTDAVAVETYRQCPALLPGAERAGLPPGGAPVPGDQPLGEEDGCP